MKIVFLTIGRFKSEPCKALLEYYIRLIRRFAAAVEVVELRNSKDETLLKWIESRTKGKKHFHFTILDERGQLFSSIEFSKIVEKIRDSSPSEWIIACGGEHGYSERISALAQLHWSLSKLTFPHELSAVLACEQVFRALSILHHHPYHNP